MSDRTTKWEGRDANGPRAVLVKHDGPFAEILQEALRKLARYEDEEDDERILHLPCAIGTPVVKIQADQHDGYWLEGKLFELRDLTTFGEYVFLNKREADKKLNELKDNSPLYKEWRKMGLPCD